MIKIKPGLDAGFFASLSMVDEKSLLQTVNALGVRRDLVSMHGFLDFLERECREGDVSDFDIFQRQGLAIQEPHTHIDSSCSKDEARGTLARALVQPLKEYFNQPIQPLADAFIAYANRMVAVLKQLPDDFRQDALDMVLFEACNLTRDARVFDLLMDAGANASTRIWTRTGSMREFMNSDAAIHHANYTGALAMAVREKDRDNSTFAIEIAVADMHQHGKSALRGFRENPTADAMIRSIAEDGRDNSDLVQLLALLSERVDDDARLVGVMESFRAGLVAGYLHQVGKTSGALWNDNALALAAGPNGLDSQGPIAQWVTNQLKQGLKSEQMLVCLTQEAIRHHCPEVLRLCEPYLRKIAGNRRTCESHEIGPLFALQPTARINANSEAPLTDAARFAETLEVLRRCGFDPTHELQPRGEDSCTALHVCAKLTRADEMLVKMPVLLRMGCDPKALDTHQKTPADWIQDPVAKARWLSVEASFRARQAMMTVLDEIDNETPTPSKMHP